MANESEHTQQWSKESRNLAFKPIETKSKEPNYIMEMYLYTLMTWWSLYACIESIAHRGCFGHARFSCEGVKIEFEPIYCMGGVFDLLLMVGEVV